jgi:propanol-preferring alcohol dehydrogenase
MKAAVMEGFRQPLVVKNVPDPTVGPGDAVIRVEGEGICHSDWHAWMGDWEWIGLKPQPPIILGHEMAGVVEEVGPGVQRVKRGDPVLVPVVWACGSCEFCLKGRQNICANMEGPELH